MKIYVVIQKDNKKVLDLFAEKEIADKFIFSFETVKKKECLVETHIVVEKLIIINKKTMSLDRVTGRRIDRIIIDDMP